MIRRVYVYARTFAILIQLALSQGRTRRNNEGLEPSSELLVKVNSSIKRYETTVQLGLEYGPAGFYSLYQVTSTLVDAFLMRRLQTI